MSKKISLWIALLGFASVPACAFAAEVDQKPSYKLAVALPAAWKLASNEKYTGGYVKVFVPPSAGNKLNEQNIVINYTQDSVASLQSSMQEIEKVIATADCLTRDVKLINQEKNSIYFATSLDRCKNGSALTQVFKVFKTPKGQYTILYSANPNRVTMDVIKNMEKLVKTAAVEAMGDVNAGAIIPRLNQGRKV